MQVISRRPLELAQSNYPNQRQALDDVYAVIKQGLLESLEATRRMFRSLDNFNYKPKWLVTNVGENHLRLIAFVQFSQQLVYAKYILSQPRKTNCTRAIKAENASDNNDPEDSLP